jgi:homocysteine S-methyltransferase
VPVSGQLISGEPGDLVLLDGGLATQLEAQGCDLSSALWSARLLREEPEQIYRAHRAFFDAGAQVATTASYQASFDGFARAGIDRTEAITLMRLSVELADRARQNAVTGDRELLIAASVGPYGAMLGDGCEYRGDYGLTVDQLRRFHRPRLEVLAESGADLLAVETIPCLVEVEALVLELDALSFPAWISMTFDGPYTRAGESAAEAFEMASSLESVVAVGVNCSAPDDVANLLHLAAPTGAALIAYPNSFDGRLVQSWIEAGATYLGGCCRVTPAAIADISALI